MDDTAVETESTEVGNNATPTATVTLSKNQLKKLRRQETWESKRAYQRAREKEARKAKKREQRLATEAAIAANPDYVLEAAKLKPRLHPKQLPITMLIDCGFDDLMTAKEINSLASQITRTYSDNHKSKFQANLQISSFQGNLKERFDVALSRNYQSWKRVGFNEQDFMHTAETAKAHMRTDKSLKLVGMFAKYRDEALASLKEQGEVVYLSSESPNTLTELKPYSTYIVGGLVDRNRHKGLCYKHALDAGIATAKLPIGDYMQMSTRFVLATNHVVEIMLRWLECGDWGEAFLQVIPKRKGGALKSSTNEQKLEDNDGNVDFAQDPVGKEEPAEMGSTGAGHTADTVTPAAPNVDVSIDIPAAIANGVAVEGEDEA